MEGDRRNERQREMRETDRQIDTCTESVSKISSVRTRVIALIQMRLKQLAVEFS